MNRFTTFSSLIGVLIFIPGFAGAQVSEWKLPNGLEVVHILKPSSKVLASIVTVNVGSKDENLETSGLSHLLEHMVFNGTRRRTRAEINEGSKQFGGYVNATTRTGYTSYISVFPADFAKLSLDLQADMLFNSTLPAGELVKERQVVIEEIKKDRDSASYRTSEHHKQVLFAGTPYSRPVLGSEETISSVTRSTVLAYYQRHYIPSRMRAMIISPYPEEKIKTWVAETFGSAAPSSSEVPESPPWTFPSRSDLLFSEDSVSAAHVHISIKAPSLRDPDFPAYDLFTRYLSEGSNAPLQKAIHQGPTSLADSIQASLETEIPFSVWEISTVTEPEHVSDLLETLKRTLQSSAAMGIAEDELIHLRQQMMAEEAILWEQPHYYGLFKAPFINAGGFQFTLTYPKRLRSVSAADIERVAEKYFSQPILLATAVIPKGKTPTLDTNVDAHVWRRERLANGMTLVAQGSDESEIFALCLFTRRRSAQEPLELEGISDFVQRMLLSGTSLHSRKEIQRKLDRISAHIQYVDNPFIPYDDHYTSNRFTFFRLEVLDTFRGEALDLIADIAGNTNFPEGEVDRLRHELFRLQTRDAGSASRSAIQRMRELLLANTPYERKILGSAASMGRVKRTDLIKHFHRLYAPSNLVLVAAGKGTTAAVMRDLKSHFGALDGGVAERMPSQLPVATSTRFGSIKMDKQQTQIAAGKLTAGWGSHDAASLRLLNAILSERLAVELRETQGLAYSVGARLQQEKDYGWIEIHLGTRSETAEKARLGIMKVVSGLAAGEVTEREIERAVNGLWGSTLRARLSRIGQVFYRGIDELQYSGFDAEERLLDELRSVSAEDLKGTAKSLMTPDGWVIISAGKP